MKIALDYDDTYTRDPPFWERFIDACQLADHEIFIVTFRDPGLPIDHNVKIPVYYTSYKAKREFMMVKGVYVDVWIDDSPDTIVGDSNWTLADREKWKEENL